ncbi:cation transporter [Rhodocytophaga rosea]|uniref:Cation transporter n=1 Tax=Rhodocytophaga rosea TaxID=2704465 RepID=A0A6C0GRP1_9BACT|nr:cation diffusion facilitator family transporter [Rhodocytophaga rosea]QHT70736.1 cation transporter [Rhodocytophaga rosea]
MANSKVSHATDQGLKTTLISILANALLAIVKGIAGIFGNSYALIADAIESTSDIFSSLIVWAGLKVASKGPDSDHPYGHGKAEPLATIVVALLLIGAAILIAIQSVKNILTPHKVPAPFTLVVLGGVIVLKEFLFRRINQTGKQINSTAVKADAWHHRSDAITSFTAFLGITIALIGGEGYENADDWAALIASVIIVFNAYHIFIPAMGEIMDVAPPEEILDGIRQVAMQVEGVRGLDKALVRKMGFEYFVDLHVLVDGHLSVKEGHRIAHQVKDAILLENRQIYDVLIHIEPF